MVDVLGKDGAAGTAASGAAASLLVSQLPGAVIAVDLSSRVVHWSDGAAALYGWTAEEALGSSVRELIRPDPRQADEVSAVTHDGGVWEGEVTTVRKDGTAMLVHVSSSAVRDASGQVVAVVGVSLDITSYASVLRARAEELQEARAQAERLADRHMRLVRVSEALAGALTVQQVADVVVAQAVEAMQADAGGLAIVEGDRLHVLATRGYEPDVVRTYEALRLDATTP